MDKKLKTFISGLFHSWGGDTPAEAIWAAEDFAVWLAECNGTTYNSQDVPDDEFDYEVFLAEIERIVTHGN